jgi:hypothetical protein
MRTDLKLKDVVRSAALFLEATQKAHDLSGGRALQTVETAFGAADVVMDDRAVDIDFHDRQETLHVRMPDY